MRGKKVKKIKKQYIKIFKKSPSKSEFRAFKKGVKESKRDYQTYLNNFYNLLKINKM